MGLGLSSLYTVMPYSVCACNVERLSALSVSWLKYTIENSSNHVLESGLELWASSNGVVRLRPSRPGTLFGIIDAYRTAKYQNYWPTCFSMINYRVIWIKVRHVHSANPLKDFFPVGVAMMLETFDNIHQGAFTPINFL